MTKQRLNRVGDGVDKEIHNSHDALFLYSNWWHCTYIPVVMETMLHVTTDTSQHKCEVRNVAVCQTVNTVCKLKWGLKSWGIVVELVALCPVNQYGYVRVKHILSAHNTH